MGVIAAAAIGLIVLMLQPKAEPPPPPPPKAIAKVVLLPDADGKAGAVIVKAEGGAEQRVDTAFGSASVNTRGAIATANEDGAAIRQAYADTLAARPSAPVSFLVYFEFGSAVDIAPVIQPTLDQLREAMARYPAAQVTVIGHTDRVGTLESNDTLSLQRAATVRDHILRAGIQPLSLEIAGRGEREPLVPTADEVPEARNRRVEIQLR